MAAAKRSTKSTAKKQPAWAAGFLAALIEHRSVTHAAKVVGKDRSTVYKLRKKDAEFAEQWDDAMQHVIEELQQSSLSVAIDGVDEPVFHEGVVCGHKRRYHPALMIFMLKKWRPERYADHIEQGVTPEDFAKAFAAFAAAQATLPKAPEAG